MPTTRGAALEDHKRWKNLLRQAEDRLAAIGQRTGEAKDFLRPARELLDNTAFWLNVSQGLAAFLSPEMDRLYRLPIVFTEQVVVAEHWHIKPLLLPRHVIRSNQFHRSGILSP
jgi:hypothetical protein